MRRAWKYLIAASLPLIVCGCSTIHFNNVEAASGLPATFTEWHHNAALQLVEVSPPVDLSQRCPDSGWARVTTELSFVGGLAHGVTSGLWTPWTVGYVCSD